MRGTPSPPSPPAWMNDNVKNYSKQKNQLYKIYAKNGYKCSDYLQLEEKIISVSQVIAKAKEDYYNIIA